MKGRGVSQLNLIQILEAERLELKESQKVFAKRFFVDHSDPQSYYSQVKGGRLKFPEKCLTPISEFLGISLEDVRRMNAEPKPKKERIKKPLGWLSRIPAKSSAQLAMEEGWQIEARSSQRDHICAYLWDDGCRNLNGDAFLETHYYRVGPEKLYTIMQAAVLVGAFGYSIDCKFLIVDSQGIVQYDGSREEPWAPWIRKRWACQI